MGADMRHCCLQLQERRGAKHHLCQLRDQVRRLSLALSTTISDENSFVLKEAEREANNSSPGA
jgi:hypothetical protein